MRGTRLATLLLSPLLLLLSTPSCDRAKPLPDIPGSASFNDFTTPSITSLAHLRQIAAAPPGDEIGGAIVGAKFVITEFSDAPMRELRFLDGRYYNYHDEWAWFRLLNGQPVSGMDELEPHLAHTPEDVRKWALSDRAELPDELSVADGRVYSAEFYERALSETDRDFGTGSVIYIPARPGRYPETWGFELEYGDTGDVEDVLVFFELLQAHLPDGVQNNFKWITRSPHQAEVAKRLVVARPELAERVMSYNDITVPGETIVYTSGIVAGRLQTFRNLATLSSANPDNILLLGALPEYLPQARGVLTAIPQTPLSHLNLLAKSRGIVNAYRGGLFDDVEILNLARSSAPVVLSTEDGTLRFQRLTELQYAQWLQLEKAPPPPPKQVAWERAPYVVELARVAPEQLEELGPLIGGKSAGIVHLLHAMARSSTASDPKTSGVDFDVPERPMAITVRAYRQHLGQLLPEIEALLADPQFVANRKLRILALEGVKKFEKRFPAKTDRNAARAYLSPSALGAVAPIVRKGGLQRMIRETPLPAAVAAELEHVARNFQHYAPEQGLRFRSSSTVEDVEGSSGAGLYESFTGFVTPRKAAPGVSKRVSLADALRKTWASYFSVEAFEERHESGMDHLSGNMAVLVHARFDDDLEDSNGVFTFTQHSRGEELLVDAQPGAVSVTNPPTDRVVRPESSRVVLRNGGFSVERVSFSSEAPPAATVLSDQELRELFVLAKRLTNEQMRLKNRALPPSQHRRSLVMDFEFRRVKRGWPALDEGVNPPRFIIKQMRPLEPNPGVPAALRSSPIPRDVLARTRRIEHRTCSGQDGSMDVMLVYTDIGAEPDAGYAIEPLFATVTVGHGQRTHTFTHLEHNLAQLTSSGLYVELKSGHAYSSVGVAGNKLQSLTSATGAAITTEVECKTTVDFAAPSELLRSFL